MSLQLATTLNTDELASKKSVAVKYIKSSPDYGLIKNEAVSVNGLEWSEIFKEINTFDYVVDNVDSDMILSDLDKKLVYVNYKNLPTKQKTLWSYFCLICGIEKVENVTYQVYSDLNEHKFTIAPKVVSWFDEKTKTNKVGLKIGYNDGAFNKPIHIEFNYDAKTQQYGLNGNKLVLRRFDIAKEAQQYSKTEKTCYYRVVMIDSANLVNFQFAINFENDDIDYDDINRKWLGGTIADIVQRGTFLVASFATMFKETFQRQQFPESGLYFLIKAGKRSNQFDTSQWSVIVPPEYSELTVKTCGKNAELTKFGDITHVHMSEKNRDLCNMYDSAIVCVYAPNQTNVGHTPIHIITNKIKAIPSFLLRDTDIESFMLEHVPQESITPVASITDSDIDEFSNDVSSAMVYEELPF